MSETVQIVDSRPAVEESLDSVISYLATLERTVRMGYLDEAEAPINSVGRPKLMEVSHGWALRVGDRQVTIDRQSFREGRRAANLCRWDGQQWWRPEVEVIQDRFPQLLLIEDIGDAPLGAPAFG